MLPRLALLTTLTLGLAACGHDTTAPSACAGNVTVSVGPGTNPAISWTPQCGVIWLTVEDRSTPSLEILYMWQLTSTASAISPPIRYGVVPDGITAPMSAKPLVAGRFYEITIFRAGDPNSIAAGSILFRP